MQHVAFQFRSFMYAFQMLAWLTLAWSVIKALFGIGAVDERDKAHDEGETQGQSEQKSADQSAVITQDESVIATQQKIERATVDDANMSDDDALKRLKDGDA